MCLYAYDNMNITLLTREQHTKPDIEGMICAWLFSWKIVFAQRNTRVEIWAEISFKPIEFILTTGSILFWQFLTIGMAVSGTLSCEERDYLVCLSNTTLRQPQFLKYISSTQIPHCKSIARFPLQTYCSLLRLWVFLFESFICFTWSLGIRRYTQHFGTVFG